MRVRIIAVGTKMPSWVTEVSQDYLKRFPREWQIDPRERVIALDVKGKSWSTEKLSEQMVDWQMQGSNIALLVGGPDGLSSQCLQRAEQRWSLSALTLPHPLVRVLLAEQLYRGWTILKNHPYHK